MRVASTDKPQWVAPVEVNAIDIHMAFLFERLFDRLPDSHLPSKWPAMISTSSGARPRDVATT